MRIGPFGHWEILIILLVVLLFFGAKRLPGMAKSVGQSVREFRRGIRDDGESATRNDGTPSEGANSEPYTATTERAERS